MKKVLTISQEEALRPNTKEQKGKNPNGGNIQSGFAPNEKNCQPKMEFIT